MLFCGFFQMKNYDGVGSELQLGYSHPVGECLGLTLTSGSNSRFLLV